MKATIKWGIVGPGNIASKFASDLKLVAGAQIAGVASRTKSKAEEFAQEFGVDQVFDSYQELFESSSVDIVYIATPHVFHKELTIQAMRAGKHVLCEKPMGVNQKEVEEMIKVAQEHQVFLMEGLWSRFNPSIQKAKSWVDEGLLGEVRYLHADFAFYGMDRDESSRLLNLNLASGSLLDIGIYPIFLAYLILGKPDAISAFSNFHPNGTELQTSMIFHYENAQAVLYSGFTSTSKMEAEISGTKGEVFIHPRWHEARGITRVINDETLVEDIPMPGNGFTYEIEEVHQCLRNGKLESDLWSHQNSLDLIGLMDAIRAKTGIKFPFEP